MKILKKIIGGLLALSLIGIYFSENAYCAAPQTRFGTEKKALTLHKPEVMSEPEKEIPKVDKEDQDQNNLKKYVWVGLASLLIAGGAAAVVASGDSDDGTGDSDNGTFKLKW